MSLLYIHNRTFPRSHFVQSTRIITPRRMVKCKAFIPLEQTTYYIGKGIILFTMFYTGLNYFYYKRLREEEEKNNKK